MGGLTGSRGGVVGSQAEDVRMGGVIVGKAGVLGVTTSEFTSSYEGALYEW